MGIHHTYKSQRGERSLQKQQKQEERRQKSKKRQAQKKQTDNNVFTLPEDEVLTLDILTKPKS